MKALTGSSPVPTAMKKHLEWTAPEFEHQEKDKSWFLISGLIAAGLFIWAIFAKNFLFALLVSLAYFSIAVYAVKKPREIKLAITSRGVKVDRTLYEYDNLRSFWIFYNPNGIKELSVRSRKTIMPYIKIPLGETNPAKVRKILIKYIPEKKQEESLVDNLARQARF